MQDQLMAGIDASRANNEELRKTNKDLHKVLQNVINALKGSEV